MQPMRPSNLEKIGLDHNKNELTRKEEKRRKEGMSNVHSQADKPHQGKWLGTRVETSPTDGWESTFFG